ncbi:unnamed protein product [Musa hybrid cultivar]
MNKERSLNASGFTTMLSIFEAWLESDQILSCKR